MLWITAIAIMVAAVLVAHIGLITAIEETASKVLRREVRLPILNCGKCLTFWSTVSYVAIQSQYEQPLWMAVILPPSMAYAAYWFELFLGMLDKLYNKAYDALYTDTGGASDAIPADRETDTDAYVAQHPADAVPMVR